MSPRFTVIWPHWLIEGPVAEFVARQFERGDDGGTIADAMNQVDRLLSLDPHVVGESRGEHERVVVVQPLTVSYEVHQAERVVLVLNAHYYPGPKSRE
jgi:hypothetical protein